MATRAAAGAVRTRARSPHWAARAHCAPCLSVVGGAPRRSLFSFGAKDGPLDVEAEAREIHSSLLTPLNTRLLGPLGECPARPHAPYPATLEVT